MVEVLSFGAGWYTLVAVVISHMIASCYINLTMVIFTFYYSVRITINQEVGKALIDFLASKYADEYSVLQVGTGDSPLTVPFYEKCGFVRSHNIANFFTDNYDHPIYECGVQLIDMVYLQRCL